MTAGVTVTVSGAGSPRGFTQDPEPALVRTYALRTVAVNLDAAMDEAAAADERYPTFSLRADWTGTGNYDHRWSNLTRMVEEFSLTEELATDLPAEVGWVEGTVATKLQVTLGGQMATDGYIHTDGTYVEEVDTVYAFSPYGPSGPGPLLGVEMQLRTGFLTSQGVADMLQFTGHLTGYSPSASTRDVTVDALDPITTLRKPVTIYAYGVDGLLLGRYGASAYPWAINNQWYIDRLLRNCGYYASPKCGGVYGEQGCTLSVTMHGSHQHEIGSVTYPITMYYTINTGRWVNPYSWGTDALPDPYSQFGPHPFEMMYPQWGYDYTIKWLCRSPGVMRPGIDGWGMSGWLYVPGIGSNLSGDIWSFQPVDRAGAQLIMQLKVINGKPYAFVSWPGGQQALYTAANFALTTNPRWIFAGMHFASEAGGVRITMNFDGNVATAFVAVPVPSNLVYEPMALAYGRVICPFTNFSIWYQAAPPGPLEWVGQTWTPTATVEPSMNWVGGMKDIINEESYDLLKKIVAAEFGTFSFDENKVPHFRSRAVPHGWNRAPELLTSDRELADLVVNVDDSQLRNSIDYNFTVLACGPWEVIWEADDPYYLSLAQGATANWFLPVPEDCPIVAETTEQVVQWVSSELWDNIDNNPYYADKVVFAASPLSNPGIDAYQGIQNGQLPGGGYFTFRVRRYDARTALLTVYNNIGFGVRFATNTKFGTNSQTGLIDTAQVTEGKPAFRLCGRPLLEYPSQMGSARHDNSIARYGLQTYDLGGQTPWRQNGDSHVALAAEVLQYTALPKPVLSQIDVPHNPRRRLNDKIILTEPDSFGARIWCTLAARTVTYNSDGARDQLTLRPDSAPPGW